MPIGSTQSVWSIPVVGVLLTLAVVVVLARVGGRLLGVGLGLGAGAGGGMAGAHPGNQAHRAQLATGEQVVVNGPAPRDSCPRIPSATMRHRDSRHRAVRNVATTQVTGYRQSGLSQAPNVTAVLIKRCRTVLAERYRYITK